MAAGRQRGALEQEPELAPLDESVLVHVRGGERNAQHLGVLPVVETGPEARHRGFDLHEGELAVADEVHAPEHAVAQLLGGVVELGPAVRIRRTWHAAARGFVLLLRFGVGRGCLSGQPASAPFRLHTLLIGQHGSCQADARRVISEADGWSAVVASRAAGGWSRCWGRRGAGESRDKLVKACRQRHTAAQQNKAKTSSAHADNSSTLTLERVSHGRRRAGLMPPVRFLLVDRLDIFLDEVKHKRGQHSLCVCRGRVACGDKASALVRQTRAGVLDFAGV